MSARGDGTIHFFSELKSSLLYRESLDDAICAVTLLVAANKVEYLIQLLQDDNVSKKTKLTICDHFVKKMLLGSKLEETLEKTITDCLCQIAGKTKQIEESPNNCDNKSSKNSNDSSTKNDNKTESEAVNQLAAKPNEPTPINTLDLKPNATNIINSVDNARDSADQVNYQRIYSTTPHEGVDTNKDSNTPLDCANFFLIKNIENLFETVSYQNGNEVVFYINKVAIIYDISTSKYKLRAHDAIMKKIIKSPLNCIMKGQFRTIEQFTQLVAQIRTAIF